MDNQLFDEYKPRAAVDFEGCDFKADLLNTFFFSGSAAEGAALLSPPTPRDEGGGVWVNFSIARGAGAGAGSQVSPQA